ncbi:hypothetical protein P43SY_004567 [Pythium insidiosum]|uniref:Glycosyltransferase 61 catalytic domain-containing protein n=1 Tax=Pythium insidiosum TaxID=114742 RepID=A0AAD5QDH2_PYTIN|nr:hypothetical protein P43SY_004567 [Pythium insidiosum]
MRRNRTASTPRGGLSMLQVQVLALLLIIMGCATVTLRGLSIASWDEPRSIVTPVQLLGGRIRRETMPPSGDTKREANGEQDTDERGLPEPQADVGQKEQSAPTPGPDSTTPTPTNPSPSPTTPPPTVSWQRATVRTSSPTPPATRASPSRSRGPALAPAAWSQCYRERDLGLIHMLQSSMQSFCQRPAEAAQDGGSSTAVSIVEVPGGLRASVWRDVVLDLSVVRIQSPIESLAQDGGGHDPRFRLDSAQIYCDCDELAAFAATKPRPLRLWDPTFAYPSRQRTEPAMATCAGNNTRRPATLLAQSDPDVLVIREKTLLMARRDDHNPFFQVSSALNAWIMLHALQWRRDEVRVVLFDGGYTSPVDTLAQRLLSPQFPLLGAQDLMGKRVHLAGDALLPPFESSGPMMQHLNDNEPCHHSELFTTFRREALEAVGANTSTDADAERPVTVTIISRRHYAGRTVHRRWRNEDEVVARMQEQYAHATHAIVIQNIDFVDLPLVKQMQLMLDSDVVIGMHGAGLVNVLWTRPETLVIEIFPRRRRRWGFRNLCQFVGCEWHEFRGGQDLSVGALHDDNAYDKSIGYDEWHRSFDPLFRRVLARRNITVR